jgi:hypothetical protein
VKRVPARARASPILIYSHGADDDTAGRLREEELLALIVNVVPMKLLLVPLPEEADEDDEVVSRLEVVLPKECLIVDGST